MSGVLRISERSSLALHAAAFIAARRGRAVAVKELAEGLSASAAHLSKVVQSLARAGILGGTRGPSGGYRLARAPREVTLLEVVEAVEGPLDVRACLAGTPVCGGKGCLLGGHVHDFNRRLRDYLAGATVSRFEGLFGAARPARAPRRARG